MRSGKSEGKKRLFHAGGFRLDAGYEYVEVFWLLQEFTF